ncbi:MAG: biopolymer transporter ExbD [Pseudomonadota bacterium]
MPQSNGALFLGAERRRRRPSLTPMIDVVFLLLVFFMLSARFGLDNAIPIAPALSGGGGYTGAPRLITVTADGVLLNGTPIPQTELIGSVQALMPSEDAIIVLRVRGEASLQTLVDVLDLLQRGGINNTVLAE